MTTTLLRLQAIERAAEHLIFEYRRPDVTIEEMSFARGALRRALETTETDYQCTHTITRLRDGEATVSRCVRESGHSGVCQ